MTTPNLPSPMQLPEQYLNFRYIEIITHTLLRTTRSCSSSNDRQCYASCHTDSKQFPAISHILCVVHSENRRMLTFISVSSRSRFKTVNWTHNERVRVSTQTTITGRVNQNDNVTSSSSHRTLVRERIAWNSSRLAIVTLSHRARAH